MSSYPIDGHLKSLTPRLDGKSCDLNQIDVSLTLLFLIQSRLEAIALRLLAIATVLFSCLRPPGRTRLWSARTESRCRAMPTG